MWSMVPLALHFVGDEHVLAVEEQDAEFLVRVARHRGGAIIDQRLPGTERGLVRAAAFWTSRKAAASTIFSCVATLSPTPSTSSRRVAGRRDHIGETAEMRDQLLGQRLHIAPRNGGEQHQLQNLIIGQRVWRRLRQSARAGAGDGRDNAARARSASRSDAIGNARSECRAACPSLWASG